YRATHEDIGILAAFQNARPVEVFVARRSLIQAVGELGCMGRGVADGVLLRRYEGRQFETLRRELRSVIESAAKPGRFEVIAALGMEEADEGAMSPEALVPSPALERRLILIVEPKVAVQRRQLAPQGSS